MARFNCLPTLLIGKKKKSKELPKPADDKKSKELPKPADDKKRNDNIILLTNKEDIISPPIEEVKKESSFDASLTIGNKEKVSPLNLNTHKVGEENSIRAGVPPETAYEGGDEHDDILSMKRDFSDFDLQALAAADNVEANPHGLVEMNPEFNKGMEKNDSDRYEGITPEGVIYNGHVSDPGMGRTTAFWGTPTLKRSCSNIEAKRASRALGSPTKTHSYGDLQILSGNAGGNPLNGFHGSPQSLKSNCSADRVMLKKRSSSQVLPSRSRRLWWKLFLWSHRNLHRSWTMKPQRISSMKGASQKKEGYTSDTLEPSHSIDWKNKQAKEERGKGKLTDMWPQNQWVAFSAESSSLDRVNAWVSSLTVSPSGLIDDDDNVDGGDIVYPSSPEIGESSGKNHTNAGRRLAEEVVQANSIIQSLNSFSSVAHISGMGLKVIPAIAAFSSLRSINLSGNYIVHITPGSLPKGLHTLDLSRNKIVAIEGLRDLTRLRVLNLSYNRIARIGHGLSNCTLIKELYLAGNKISDVEGLHRLLKLTVLDLSFNKITTAKALGQLVANYNSLLALNLLGNPIQSNIGDDQLRKAVMGLLPQLAYLNKQPIKPQRVREVATDSIAKAALGNGGWSSRRRSTRRVSQGLGSSVSGHRAVGSGSIAGQKGSRNRSKSRQKH